jgi:exopolyphosphatase / guanosine-5'-triphosphate,3'-diphosphate pyrophosphatase
MGCQDKKRNRALDEVPGNSKFASVDIGSHTIRLLIAQVGKAGEVHPLKVDRQITQLARNFSVAQTLDENRIDASIMVLKEFAYLIRRHGVQSVNCGATGVIRRARNAEAFLQRITEATGILPSILSEEAEAFLAAKGILSGLPQAGRFVLSFDLGGSSTELLLIDPPRAESLWSTSIFIGAATITERCLSGDPPDASSLVRAIDAIRDALGPSLLSLREVLQNLHIPTQSLQLVGTAGTVTTLAAMLLKMSVYKPSRVNGLILTETWINQLIGTLSVMPLTERLQLAGLEKGREAIILAGALIVRELLGGLEHTSLTVVDSGLLEGLLLALIEKESGLPAGLASPLTFRLQKG